MKIITIGVIDYGMGNHASVAHSLRDLGFRVRITKETAELDLVDAMVLPGVGAFPAAMRTLHERGLVTYLQEQARQQRPLLGICLGMQLLASTSSEHEHTAHPNLVPPPTAHSEWPTMATLHPWRSTWLNADFKNFQNI